MRLLCFVVSFLLTAILFILRARTAATVVAVAWRMGGIQDGRRGQPRWEQNVSLLFLLHLFYLHLCYLI